jgi:hypothetical protein
MEIPAGVRRLCVAYDIEDYSTRRNRGQLAAQDQLARVIRDACAAAGLADEDFRAQHQGDGGLVLLPTGGEIDEPLLISAFLGSLEASLREVNRGAEGGEPIRLRVALREGIVFTAAHGYAGDAVVDAFRMCDAPAVRRILKANPDADLVIVVSDGLHRDVVRHGDHGLPGDAFVRHPLQVKQFSDTAWVYVPGGDAGLPPEPKTPGSEGSFLTEALDTDLPYDLF